MIKPFNRIKLIGSFRDMGFWRTPAETRKMRMAYPFFSGFVANSQAVKNHFVRTDGIPAGKFEVIYNGIDPNEVHPRDPREFADESPIIGIVANLNRPVKRVQDFVQAAGIVHRAFPSARFVVVGDGYLRSQLEELGEALGLRDSLTFTGRLDNPLEVVRSFHVGVITSETEGFCNAIVEYMACGIPVVATDSGGNPELVRERENGFLYPVGNIDALADRVEMILKNEEIQYRFSKNNRKKIDENFTGGILLQKNYSYYERILNHG
jgi:glycosyltransferase involved in cell wall biosynthesis